MFEQLQTSLHLPLFCAKPESKKLQPCGEHGGLQKHTSPFLNPLESSRVRNVPESTV